MSSLPAAATTDISETTIAPALFLLVPLFTVALVVLALSHRPHQGQRSEPRTQAQVAYAFVGTLATLSTLAGALPLSRAPAGTPRVEAVVQALLSSLLGIPVLYLVSRYSDSKAESLLEIIHSTILVITLSGATLLALVAPFLPSSSTACPAYLPSAIFLVYSLLALARIAVTLFRFLHPSSRPRVRATRRPITIHVSTHRTSIPLSLPSPASSAASFPLSDPHDEDQRPIELEITLPKRRSHLDEKRFPQTNEKHHHKHEKTTSVDSTTSTLTAVDHTRYNHHRSLSPPLTSLALGLSSWPLPRIPPPRAVYTSAYTPASPRFSFARNSRTAEQLYRFPIAENTEGESDIVHSRQNDGGDNSLRAQLIQSRSRSLLVFLLAAQITLLVGYACAVAIASIPSSRSSTSISISTVSSSSPSESASASAIASLRIVQAACIVLAVTGTMSAYLLHAYNTHLLPSRSSSQSRPRGLRPQSLVIPSSSTSSMPYNSSGITSATAVPAYARSSTTGEAVQTIDISAANAHGGARPVVIQLAVPPARTRRKRVDALELGRSSPGSGPNYATDASPSSGSNSNEKEIVHITQDPQPPMRDSGLVMMDEEKMGLQHDLSLKSDMLLRSSSISSVSSIRRRKSASKRVGSVSLIKPKTRPAQLLKSTMLGQKAMDDPATYFPKGGSVPVAAYPRRLFGWDFRWDALPLAGGRGRVRTKAGFGSGKNQDTRKQGSSFMDLRGEKRVPAMQKRKSKRYSMPPGFGVPVTEKLEDSLEMTGVGFSPASARNKLKKKRSQSMPRNSPPAREHGELPVPMPMPIPNSLPFPLTPTSGYASTSTSPTSATTDSFNFGSGVGLETGHDVVRSTSTRSSSVSRPGTAESPIYGSESHRYEREVSLASASRMKRGLRGGLSLKRSFKMGVGRTLGPGLTLASASADVDEAAWEEEKEEKSASGDECDTYRTRVEDYEAEVRSIAGAKLVSASIARVTPAATIMTASLVTPPPTPPTSLISSSNPASRPALPAIVTSSTHPIPYPLSATSGNSPVPHTSESIWMPHPFADPAELPVYAINTISQGAENAETAITGIQDDVVQLKCEMEEIRGLRQTGSGNDDRHDSHDRGASMDSPFKALAAFANAIVDNGGALSAVSQPAIASSSSPSASASPSLTGVFALDHAQAQTAAPPPEKPKGKNPGGGHPQKRVALSSPPVPQSDWVAQSPAANNYINGGSTGLGGFLYNFPMIFPHSFVSSSSGSSPPGSSFGGQHQHQSLQLHSSSSSMPSTPSKAGSSLRLSAMGSVRNAFAGVGARMSSATTRMSMNSMGGGSLRSAGVGAGFGEMITEDGDGDFMDLRDPFASPPPSFNISTTSLGRKHTKASGSGLRAGDNFLMLDSGMGHESENVDVDGGLGRSRTTAWGKLPMPMPIRPLSPTGSGHGYATSSKKNISSVTRPVRIVGKSSTRKHRKRSRRSSLPPGATALSTITAGVEDADFGIEEALLSQRLLSRLDSDGWESRE